MKKGYKICPYCGNEIKEGAIKCQYCKEFLDVKKTKKVEVKEIKTVVKKSGIKKSDKQEKNIKINYSSIRGIIGDIFTDFGELLKVVFSVGENRIGVGKGITLYLFGMLLIAGFMCLLALPFGEKPFESEETNAFTVLTTIFFIVYLRGYLAPKRAMDHGQPRYIGIIPIVNAFYFLTSGDKGDNQYGEKPSILRTLGSRWHDKKDNKNISKYGAIILLILMIVLCCLLIPSETKSRNRTNYNTNSIIGRPSILDEPYVKSEYTEEEREKAFEELMDSLSVSYVPEGSIYVSSVEDYKNKSTLYKKIEICKGYEEGMENFLKEFDNHLNKYYNTDALSFIKSDINGFNIRLVTFKNLTLSPFVESCIDYYQYMISIQSKFEIDDGKLSFYDQADLDLFNKKYEERSMAEEKFKEQTLKFNESVQNM